MPIVSGQTTSLTWSPTWTDRFRRSWIAPIGVDTVVFRQVSALFGAGLGILFLKETQWKTRITGVLILTLGLILIGFAK